MRNETSTAGRGDTIERARAGAAPGRGGGHHRCLLSRTGSIIASGCVRRSRVRASSVAASGSVTVLREPVRRMAEPERDSERQRDGDTEADLEPEPEPEPEPRMVPVMTLVELQARGSVLLRPAEHDEPGSVVHPMARSNPLGRHLAPPRWRRGGDGQPHTLASGVARACSGAVCAARGWRRRTGERVSACVDYCQRPGISR